MSGKIDRSGAGPCGPCLLPLEALQPPPVASTTSPFRNREMMEKTSPGNASSAGLSIGSVSPKFQSGSPKTPVTTVEPLVPPTRVAVVGAGPVGLWIAVLLARAHARFFQTSSGFRISRHPQAPVINVIWAARVLWDPQLCYKLPISMFEYWLVMIGELCEPEFCSRSGMKPGIKKKY